MRLSELIKEYAHHGRMKLHLDMRVDKEEEPDVLLRALAAKVERLERELERLK